MSKTCTFIALMVALSLSMLGQEAPTADANPAAQEEIKKLEMDLAKLLVQADGGRYGSHLTEDYVRITTTGQVKHRAEVLSDLRSEKDKLLDVIPEELEVRIYGDTAVLTGHLSELTRSSGRVTTVFSRFTSVFVKRNGAWFLANLQSTQVFK
jgi:ketosteroid isomerase-like protein